MKLIPQLALLFVAFTTCANTAQAHAFLDHSEPKVGSAVKGSPNKVRIWFTKDLERASSNITVYDDKGAEVDKKDIKIDPDDHSLMSVSVPRLPTGTYKVVWNAVCKDTHHTTGSFTFVIVDSNS
jgi:copper resistance protein C